MFRVFAEDDGIPERLTYGCCTQVCRFRALTSDEGKMNGLTDAEDLKRVYLALRTRITNRKPFWQQLWLFNKYI